MLVKNHTWVTNEEFQRSIRALRFSISVFWDSIKSLWRLIVLWSSATVLAWCDFRMQISELNFFRLWAQIFKTSFDWSSLLFVNINYFFRIVSMQSSIKLSEVFIKPFEVKHEFWALHKIYIQTIAKRSNSRTGQNISQMIVKPLLRFVFGWFSYLFDWISWICSMFFWKKFIVCWKQPEFCYFTADTRSSIW